jgi:hypothetical protein
MKNIRLVDVDVRLREEGRTIRARDDFSRLLHERCMATLRREGLTGTGAVPGRRYVGWRAAVGIGVAAAVALGAWMMMRVPVTPESPEPLIVTPVKPEAPGNEDWQAGSPIALPAATVLDERKYAYLDRDAKRLLIFVADQFPEFPSQATNMGPGNEEPAPK